LPNQNQKNNSLKSQAIKLVVVGIVLIGLIVTCMLTDGILKSIFVTLYYLVTFISVFLRRYFDAQVEQYTGKKRTVSPYLDLSITLILAFAIHWLLFWN